MYSNGFYVYYDVSLMTLCAISCERLIALIYPLRYFQIVRHKRVLKTIVFIWLINMLLTSLHMVPDHKVDFRGIGPFYTRDALSVQTNYASVILSE